MRPLTEEETKTFFEKLSKFIGRNIKLLIDRPDGVSALFHYFINISSCFPPAIQLINVIFNPSTC